MTEYNVPQAPRQKRIQQHIRIQQPFLRTEHYSAASRSRQPDIEASDAVESALSFNTPLLLDSSYAEAVLGLQQAYGNSYVQRLAEDGAIVTNPNEPAEIEAEQAAQAIINGDRAVPLPQVRTATMIARAGEEELETATVTEGKTALFPEEEAGSQSFEELLEELASQWPMLASFEVSEILDHIRQGRQQEALEALWDNIGWELPLAPRITVELTAELGTVEDEFVLSASSASGLTLGYVLRQPACASAATAHYQLHTPTEIQFFIQINPSVFHQGADNAKVAMLLSTLMHEYTHAEQIASRPIDPRATFILKSNNREFLGEQAIPLPERELLIAHDEIDAYCSEIENAERTGLAQEYNIGGTVGSLWTNYVTYYHRTNNNPEQEVAQRVHICIQRGRDMFFAYLDSDAARSWLTESQRTLLRNNTPPGYDENLFPPSPHQG